MHPATYAKWTTTPAEPRKHDCINWFVDFVVGAILLAVILFAALHFHHTPTHHPAPTHPPLTYVWHSGPGTITTELWNTPLAYTWNLVEAS